MDILVRLANDTGDPLPLRVHVSHDATIGDLADHLAGWLDGTPGSTIKGLRRDDLVRDVGPRSGSLVRLAPPVDDVSDHTTAPVKVLSTLIDGGLATGEVRLRYGANDLGPVSLNVSREIELLPHPDTWVFVNGHRTIGSRRVSDGDLISIAERNRPPATTRPNLHQVTNAFAVEVIGALDPPEHGPYRFHRPAARTHDEYVSPVIAAPPAPETLRPPGLPVLSAVVPLLFGAVLWVATRSMASTVFVLFSFFYIAVAGIESRWEFRKDTRHRETEFKRAAARALDQLRHAHEDEGAYIDRTSPDRSTVRDLVETLSPRMWERSPDDTTGGFLSVRIGSADREGHARIERPSGGRSDLVEWFEARLSTTIHDELPVTIDLSDGGGLGLIGGSETITDLARWIIVQLTALIGPDLLGIVVLTSSHRRDTWRWTKWLPHVDDSSDPRWTLVVVDGADEDDVLRIMDGRDQRFTRFLWIAPQRCDLPRIIGQSVSLGRVPAVIRAREADRSSFAEVDLRDLTCDGITHEDALDTALQLTALVPQRVLESHGIDDPGHVTLSAIDPTVDLDDPESILSTWRGRASVQRLAAPLARSGPATMELDLTSDGPHALVAGMTGAGKSELLRTWLTSLALHHPPDRVTFLLIDYKGGSAFGPLSRLPHTVGLITDLDTELADRAMVSLRAELRARESWLATVGAASMAEVQGREGRPPALVVAVDEFATLSKELPGMVDELVDVAQRGRSLGIHLILATQRPHGVVSESIRANTSIRIALRVADASDSTDVIDAPDAVSIARTSPGSAIVRVGQARSGTVRFAYSSGPFTRRALVSSNLLSSGDATEPGMDPNAPTEIEVATRSVTEAFRTTGEDPPRRPWVAPLEPVIALGSIEETTADGIVTIGMTDRPQDQDVVPLVLDLNEGTGLVVFGTAGPSRSMVLSTVAEAAAHTWAEPLIYSIGGSVDHATDSIPIDDSERVLRVLRQALAQVRDQGVRPRTMILIDDIAVFENHYETLNRGEAIRIIEQICRRGLSGGVDIVVGASRRMDLPATIAVGFRHRIVLGLTSQDEAALLGVPAAMSRDLPLGRGFHDGHWVQIATGRGCRSCPTVTHRPVVRLPERVRLDDVIIPNSTESRRQGDRPWRIPIGLTTDDLTVALLDLTHSHGLIAGPRRSGRSTTLRTIASGWMRSQAEPDGISTVLITPGDPLAAKHAGETWRHEIRTTADSWTGGEPSEIEAALAAVLVEADSGRGVLIAMDELPVMLEGRYQDSIERFINDVIEMSTRAAIRIIASGEIDSISRCYSPALTAIRAGRTGILLRPDTTVHGSILGCDLGRRDELVMQPGRGWLVAEGDATPVQIASADNSCA